MTTEKESDMAKVRADRTTRSTIDVRIELRGPFAAAKGRETVDQVLDEGVLQDAIVAVAENNDHQMSVLDARVMRVENLT